VTYVCGHSSSELDRLETQGRFFEAISRRVLADAGLVPGMRVLDVGCGAGDLTFLASELVGPHGRVLGIDREARAVETAARRASARGIGHVAFRVAAIGDDSPDGDPAPFDAVIGRFVLMHQADPAAALAEAARHAGPGGTVAVLESHMHASIAGAHSFPFSTTYDRILRWIVQIIEAAGAHADMGLRLRTTFRMAGLPAPAQSMHARVDGGPGAPVYAYIVESLRSMMPLGERFGIVALSTREIDDLERTLREEVTASGGVLVSPTIVSGWCRLPGGASRASRA
jgi:ubiquinone/menaquinone biosynthesis C-methylase UbiE